MSKIYAVNPPASLRSGAFDRVLDRFETAWRQGKPPAIADFLPAAGAGGRSLLHELIKIDLEYRWRRMNATTAASRDESALPARPLLEEYVKRLPRLGPLQSLPVALIVEEYRVRQRWGDRPAHTQYVRRFPRHGESLRAALAAMDAELRDESPTLHLRPQPSARGADKAAGLSEIAHILCPHCRQAIEVVAGLEPSHLACPACGDAFSVESLSKTADSPAQPPARRLGRYELGDLLGTGAFGSVWQAWDTELAREVAVKLPRSGRFSSPGEEERFLREARSAAQLQHAGIVAVHDVGRAEDTLYIISELVRGVNLGERLRKQRLSFREAAELTAQAADALDYAHRQGVVHRDVKPSNIQLVERVVGSPSLASSSCTLHPKIMDFGLALRDAGEITMTMDGQVLGTPAYMSPEQIRNPHAVDGRSDLYSLGVILYELLTGELPFRGTTRMLLAQVVADEARPPRRLNDRIPRDLETICLKCLAKERGRRYQSAGALAADLRRWLAGEPILARPVGRLERLWLWAKRHPILTVTGALVGIAFVAVTGAPVAGAMAAIAAAAILFALRKAKAVVGLTHAIKDAKRTQKKTAAALQFAFRNCCIAREEQKRAVAAETQARSRLAPAQELVRAVLFDLPERITDPSSRAALVRTAMIYLNALAKEAGEDASLLRELAVAYARVGDLQGSPHPGDVIGALASHRKSLEIFVCLADVLRDNAQAKRDLTASRGKVADLERALTSNRASRSEGRRGQ